MCKKSKNRGEYPQPFEFLLKLFNVLRIYSDIIKKLNEIQRILSQSGLKIKTKMHNSAFGKAISKGLVALL